MTRICLALMALAALVFTAAAAEPPETTPKPQAQRVWTADDVAQLPGTEAFRAREAEQPAVAATPEAAAEPAVAAEEAPPVVEYVKELDPEWYRARLAAVDAELAQAAAREARLLAFLAAPRENADPGLVLNQSSLRLSPENELLLLAARRTGLRAQREEILLEARRHWLPPGLFR